MPKMFEEIKVGDQLELLASRGAIIYSDRPIDPERICAAAIVTHIWFDPVDAKEYVGLAHFRADGSYGKPTEKRTITGLARCGWRYAKVDWEAKIKAMQDSDKVISIFGRRHQ